MSTPLNQSQKDSVVAPHLTEFQKIISSNLTPDPGTSSNTTINSSYSATLHDSDKLRLHRKPSFTSSSINSNISLTPSTLADLQHSIITSSDRKEFETMLYSLLKASRSYSDALTTVSKAASEFGFAMESLAKLKGAQEQSDMLLACSGLHLLISNHHQVLSWTMQENFSKKFESLINKFQHKCKDNDVLLNGELKNRIKKLKVLEKDNYRIFKSKKRNLFLYKETLQKINNQIDSIDTLKFNYYDSLGKLILDTSSKIVRYGQVISKAEFEIYESIARKGWTEGSSNDLVSNCSDPFELYSEDDNLNIDTTEQMQQEKNNDEDEDEISLLYSSEPRQEAATGKSDNLDNNGNVSLFKESGNNVIFFHTKINEVKVPKVLNSRGKIRSPFLNRINSNKSSLRNYNSGTLSPKSPMISSFNSGRVLDPPFMTSPNSIQSLDAPNSPTITAKSTSPKCIDEPSTSLKEVNFRPESEKNVVTGSDNIVEGLRINLANEMNIDHAGTPDNANDDGEDVDETDEADDTIIATSSENGDTDDDNNSLSLPNAVSYSPR